MLTLDLTNAPRWHDLAPGVRVQLRPLTTALMVATRSDPAVEAVPEGASDEERAVVFAKALARRAGLAWEGIGDADGNPIKPSPEAIDALLDVLHAGGCADKMLDAWTAGGAWPTGVWREVLAGNVSLDESEDLGGLLVRLELPRAS